MYKQEHLEEAQENEILLLKSIYQDDLKDLRKNDKWKVKRPPEFMLKLKPQQSTTLHENFAEVDLHIKIPPKYPYEVPQISIVDSKCLTKEMVSEISKDIQELCNDLIKNNEVLIFEVALLVQKYLYDHNKPPPVSFYEEMLKNKERKEAQTALFEKQCLEYQAFLHEKKVLELQKEVNLKQESLKEEKKIQKFSKNRYELSDSSSVWSEQPSVLRFENHCQSVQKGTLIGKSRYGSLKYYGIDVNSGDYCVISEWLLTLESPVGKNMNGMGDWEDPDALCMKELSSIVQDFLSFKKLNHSNLVKYLNFDYSLNHIVVIEELIFGSNLKWFLQCGISVEYQTIRHLAQGILDGLHYLHKEDTPHGCISDSTTFIDNNGRVKMCGYGVSQRLCEYHAHILGIEFEDSYPKYIGRHGKKTDIYDLGVLLLSLYSGKRFEVPISVIPAMVPSDLKNFIQCCLMINKSSQWSVQQLINHSFLKTPIAKIRIGDKHIPVDVKEENCDQEVAALSSFQINTRLHNEFEVLKWLGGGGFGDVFKVKNKLDGGLYAIKQIRLNPKNVQLNKKIIREVKLLSRLNHENIVRYYNAWIETLTSEKTSSDDSSKASSPRAITQQRPENKPKSISVLQTNAAIFNPNLSVLFDDMESSEDEGDDWLIFRNSNDSNSVVFEGSKTAPDNDNLTSGDNIQTESSCSIPLDYQYLHIQMEFCEKSTLRSVIDGSLHQDMDRVWRLFREIVEGLVHIHQQGVIHRDLKPVNIFLDSEDHVKIGDFGLATSDIIGGYGHEKVIEMSGKESNNDELLTGKVGTTFYVAPELEVLGNKAVYNQKVDIYSLGIIFFEMCYHPFSTGMERCKSLNNLRKREVLFPDDFDTVAMSRQSYLIRWLLSFEPTERPTSFELIQSEYLPPPQFEETEFREIIKQVIANPQTKSYKYLIYLCFLQETSSASNITYDMDMSKSAHTVDHLLRHMCAKDTLTKIFRRHGAIEISSPSLMPRDQTYRHIDNCVKMMDPNGGVMTLPYDLRVPFARFIVRNGMTDIRRYCISKVYREKKILGFHPRELYECAFDIVSASSSDRMIDAELLLLMDEIIEEFSLRRNLNLVLHVNHISLTRAVLFYYRVEIKYHDYILTMLSKSKAGYKSQLATQLSRIGFADDAVKSLFSILEVEGSLCRIKSAFKNIFKSRDKAGSIAKAGFNELESILGHAVSLGLKCPVVISPNLIFNLHQHSGFVFQLVCESSDQKKAGRHDIIAAGGRYDKLLTDLRNRLMDMVAAKSVSQTAVGVSISLDKFLSSVTCDHAMAPFQAVLWSPSALGLGTKTLDLAREMWAAGISTYLHQEPLQQNDHIHDLLNSIVPCHILMKDDDMVVVRMKMQEKEKIVEKKLHVSEVVDFLSKNPITKGENENCFGSKVATRTPGSLENHYSTNTPVVGYTFICNEKLVPNVRRRHEILIHSNISSALQHLSTRSLIEVVAMDISSSVIKCMVSYLDFESTETFENSLNPIREKHPKCKKQFSRIFDELYDLYFEKHVHVLILYSLPDNGYRVIF